HEVSHGTSNRLHGNSAGLGSQGGMMGEGWGDFYAHTLLAEDTDGVNGVYALSGYSTSGVDGFIGSYYYGIRRFPTAVISLTGGPARAACNNAPCPHNPLTFKHINTGCDTTLGTNGAVSSAFPRNPVFGPNANCSQVHNGGEIWKSALWEVRARMVSRLGFMAGTTRVLQVVTDGMKLSPISPTMLQERDGIIAAAAALPFAPEAAADVTDIREGFRVRGMGFTASVQSTSAVTEAFDFPNVQHIDPFAVSDASGDGDGFPEPNENVLLSVPVTNATGGAITNVQANVDGGTNVSYGTINDGQTTTMQIPYHISAGALCGSFITVQINVTSSVAAQTPINRQFRLGAPVAGAPATFTNNTLINLPNGQPATSTGAADPYPSDIAVTGLNGNKTIKVNLLGLTHTFPGDLDFLLVGPGGQKFIFASDSGDTGNVTGLDISFADNGASQPSATQWVAGTFKPVNSGANDAFAAPAPAGPYTNAAPAGTDTFASVFGSSGAAMNGTWSLYSVDDASGDVGTMAGWSITFEPDDYACNVAGSNVSVSGRVVNAGGRGIAKTFVVMTDGVTPRVVLTNSFGYFAFPGVPSAVQYTISPSQKRFTFTPQQITPAANVTGLLFVGI
ncbi:MAG: M36 family metallopeptidase, partial [Pyrinomonadaceae bacterium]